jgi:hypothetical protein
MATEEQQPPCLQPAGLSCPCCGGVGSHNDRWQCRTCGGWGILAGITIHIWSVLEELIDAVQRGRV